MTQHLESAVARAEARSAGKDPYTSVSVAATHGSLSSCEQWAQEITHAWQKAVASILETGTLLHEAKTKLDEFEFASLQDLLPFGKRTTERLIAISKCKFIIEHQSRLPPSWRTLYELSRLSEQTFLTALDDGMISPDMERSTAELLAKEEQHDQVSEEAADSTSAEADEETETEDGDENTDTNARYDVSALARNITRELDHQLKYLPPSVAYNVTLKVLGWLTKYAKRVAVKR